MLDCQRPTDEVSHVIGANNATVFLKEEKAPHKTACASKLGDI